MQINKKKMYGLLHTTDGAPIQRQVRILKVAFGIPSGPDIHAWIALNGKWRVEIGVYADTKRQSNIQEFATKQEAVEYYGKQRAKVHDRKYPRKIPYFTFLRMGMDGNYVHDFDAIEHHGPIPSEIDVIFLNNEPFDYSYQWWTAAEMKCEGDGINAMRRLSEAKTDAEKKLADEARAKGEQFFPITNGCYTMGCPFAQGDKPVCKPHGRLHYQLLNAPRIGGTCSYDTTGKRSIAQLYSCIEQIKAFTGHGDAEQGKVAGIPLQLVLRPYKTSHNGQPSVQYGVSLEFRAENAVELMRSLHGHADEFAAALQSVPLQLEANDDGVVDADVVTDNREPFDTEEEEAAAMAGEFYGDFEEAMGEDDPADAPTKPEIPLPTRKSDKKEAAQQTTLV